MGQWGSSGMLWGGGVAEAVYPAYHVILGGVGLVFGPGGYERRLQQAFAAKLSTSQLSQDDRLTDQLLLLDNWNGGEGYLRHEPDTPDRYRSGSGIDPYSEEGAVALGPHMVTEWSSSLDSLLCAATVQSDMHIGTSTGLIYKWAGSGTPSLMLTSGKAGGITALIRAGTDAAWAGNGSDGVVYQYTTSGGWVSHFTLSETVTSCRAMAAHWKGSTKWFYLGADRSGGAAKVHYSDGSTTTPTVVATTDEPRLDVMVVRDNSLVIVGTDHTHRRTAIYEIDDSSGAGTGFTHRWDVEGAVLQCGAVLGDRAYFGDKYGGRIWRWDGSSLRLFHELGTPGVPYTGEIRGIAAYQDGLWVSILDTDGTIGLLRFDGNQSWARPVTGLTGTTPGPVLEYAGRLCLLTSATGASKLRATNGTFGASGNVESGLLNAKLAGTDKLLRGVTVNHSELAATQSVEVQYQLEDDGTWVSLGTSDTDGATTASFDFPSAITADLFALKLILTGTAGSSTPLKVYSVNLRYYPAPGAKHEWSLTVRLEGTAADPLTLADGTSETRTGEELSAEVWALVDTGAPVNLVDVDRSEYTVQIAEYREGLSSIRPNVDPLDNSWQLQGSLRLVEV